MYYEGDEVTEIFFIINGKAAYVLDNYKNYEYIKIKQGDEFGLADIALDTIHKGIRIDKLKQNKDLIHRQFSIMATGDIELYCFSVNNLNQMGDNFQEIYFEFLNYGFKSMRSAWMIKQKALRKIAEKLPDQESDE